MNKAALSGVTTFSFRAGSSNKSPCVDGFKNAVFQSSVPNSRVNDASCVASTVPLFEICRKTPKPAGNRYQRSSAAVSAIAAIVSLSYCKPFGISWSASLSINGSTAAIRHCLQPFQKAVDKTAIRVVPDHLLAMTC